MCSRLETRVLGVKGLCGGIVDENVKKVWDPRIHLNSSSILSQIPVLLNNSVAVALCSVLVAKPILFLASSEVSNFSSRLLDRVGTGEHSIDEGSLLPFFLSGPPPRNW